MAGMMPRSSLPQATVSSDPPSGTPSLLVVGGPLTSLTWLACPGMVTAWDMDSQMVLKKYQPRTTAADSAVFAKCLECDETGENLVAGYTDGKARLWAIKSGRLLRTFTSTTFGGVTAVCTIPGVGATVEATVLTGSEDGLVKQFAMSTGDLLHTISVGATVVGLSGQGAKLWVASATGKISQYNMVTASKALSYEGAASACQMMKYANSAICVGSAEGKIHIWDITSREPVTVTTAHRGAVVALGVDVEGHLWSVAEDAIRGERLPSSTTSPRQARPAEERFSTKLAEADAKQVSNPALCTEVCCVSQFEKLLRF